MNWEAFKAKMRSRGIEPGFFAFSRLHQLDPAFIKEMNIAIGIRKEDGAPEYQAALKTAEGDDRNRGADLNGDASSRITRATASLRQTTEDLIANREARESTTSNEKNL